MCLIVDANVVGVTLTEQPAPDFAPILAALRTGGATVVYGGKLTEEYARVGHVLRLLAALDRSGRARQLSSAAISAEVDVLRQLGRCCSNDLHVIAIARLGRVRLLCSRDKPLHQDFRNKDLLDNPRGNIYQDPSHVHLLRAHCADCAFCGR